MKSCFIAALLILIPGRECAAQDTLSPPPNRRALWLALASERRNPETAALCSFAIPTLGHAYAGNWKRGLLFGGGRLAIAGLTYFGGVEHKSFFDGRSTVQSTRLNELFWVGLTSFVVVSICEAADAYHETTVRNTRWFEDVASRIDGSRGAPAAGSETLPGSVFPPPEEPAAANLLALETPPDTFAASGTACSPEGFDSARGALYGDMRKSPLKAALFSVIPGAGHRYVGKSDNMWIFGLGRSAGMLLLAAGTFEAILAIGSSTDAVASRIRWTYVAGISCSVGFLLWEAVDAAHAADQYNDWLCRTLSSGMNIGFSPEPGGIRVGLSRTF